MADETDLPEPITVEFREYRKRTFKTVEQISRWAETERDAWTEFQKLTEPTKPHNQVNPAHHSIQKAQNILKLAAAFLSNTDTDHRVNHRNTLKIEITQYGKQRNFLSSECVLAKQIIALAETNPKAAFVWLERETVTQVQTGHVQKINEYVQALVDAEIARHDVTALTANNPKELEAAKAEWDEAVEVYGEAHSLMMTQHHKDRDQLKTKTSVYRIGGFRQAIKSFRALDNALTNHEEKMEGIQQAFVTDQKLSASELYWNKKRKLNAERAKSARNQFFCGIAGSIPFILLYVIAITLTVGDYLKVNLPLTFLAYGVPALLIVWGLRILARRYQTNEALADDAEERMAMVRTFKALEYEDKAAPEERIVALHALFRSHYNPIEDTLPNPVLKAILDKLK